MFPFITMSALLVITPGPSVAVVMRNALDGGGRAGMFTVAGIGFANSCHALATLLGVTVLLQRSPTGLTILRTAGAAYLIVLGVQGLWRIRRAWPTPDAGGSREGGGARASLQQGFVTNLLHPSVALFYLSYIPQFIPAGRPFGSTYLLLAATHVAMSVTWLTACVLAVSAFSSVLSRPPVVRGLRAVTSIALLLLGGRLLLAAGSQD